MTLLGPAVEPGLSPTQAAKAKGSCQKNIREAYNHLGLHHDIQDSPDRIPYVTWAARLLFREATAAVLSLVRRMHLATS